jgi:branched-chain amino acid aminotransferase
MLSDLKVTPVSRSRRGQVNYDDLGFGRYFSDHMFSMVYKDGRWSDPRILPYDDVPIAPGALCLHYGQMAFEGLKASWGSDGNARVFRPDMNERRLRDSCQRLCIPQLPEGVFNAAIESLVQLDQDWIPHKRGQSLYIRPLIISTEPSLEVRASKTYRFLIMTSPARNYYGESRGAVSLKVEEHYTRAAPGGTGSAKTGGNYAASLLPGDEARRQGFDQVLWTDGAEHRYVEEVGQMNIFFRLRDRVITPAQRGTILPGVTRDSVLTLLRDFGIPAEERLIPVEEVVSAIQRGDMLEAFGAGTAAVISPVGKIGYRGQMLLVNSGQPGELAQRLWNEITGIQCGEIPDRHGWNLLVKLPQSQAVAASAAG